MPQCGSDAPNRTVLIMVAQAQQTEGSAAEARRPVAQWLGAAYSRCSGTCRQTDEQTDTDRPQRPKLLLQAARGTTNPDPSPSRPTNEVHHGARGQHDEVEKARGVTRALQHTTVTTTIIMTLLPLAACVHSYHNKSGALTARATCRQRGVKNPCLLPHGLKQLPRQPLRLR